MTGDLRVSVVIPVRDRRDLLADALKGLARQTYPDFEVVVVDDGSRDGSGKLASEAATDHFLVRVIRTEGGGAVAARCVGVEAAVGEILAFTDSDCVPGERWLESGVAAIENGAGVVTGPTVPAGRVGVGERSVSFTGYEGMFATCNVFYSRDAYVSTGGFDLSAASRLGFSGGSTGRGLGFGEDTLLGWRVARNRGWTVAGEASVRHAVVRPSMRELFSRAWTAGSFPALIRETPELRKSILRRRIFLGFRRLPLYATVVASALGRGELIALALGWWVLARSRQVNRLGGPIPRRLGAVPVEMTIDVVMAAALGLGSARSKRVVV